MNKLEQAILDIIEKKYKRKYVGEIKVTKLGKSWAGYKLVLGPLEKPFFQLAADLEAEDFLKYVEQELVSRQLHKVQFFTGIKRYPEDETRGTCQEN